VGVNAQKTWLAEQGKSANENRDASGLEGRRMIPALQPSSDGDAALPAAAERAIGARTIRSLANLDELEPMWPAARAELDTPMERYDWIRISADVFGLKDTLEVVVSGNPPSLAIAPLFRTNGVVRRLESIGADMLAEPADFVYASPAECEALTNAVAGLRLPLFLRRVPARSPIAATLKSALGNSGLVICRATAGTPWISLDKSWETPQQHLNAGRRSDLRRAQRIAERLGGTRCEVKSPTPAELAPLLEEAYRVEAAGWKGPTRTALAMDALRGEFFRRYAYSAASKGVLRLCFLRIGGRAAAMQFAVEIGNRFWLLKIGFAHEFARCSPGNLLVMETIRYAARAGLRSYEFLGTAEPWIGMWTSQVRPCISLRAYPFNGRGAVAFVTDATKVLGKKIRSIPWSRA
jgi:CelD/BcsL family acetyltransferase involved in cellulose biosynthesis